MEELTHWKKNFNPNYLGAYSFEKGEIKILTIASVKLEQVLNAKGQSEECTVAHFVQQEKPMILNRTNCKAITTAYATPYLEEWVGKDIEIYVARVQAFKESVDALRVKPYVPRVKREKKVTPEEAEKRLTAKLATIQTDEELTDFEKSITNMKPEWQKKIEAKRAAIQKKNQ